MQKQFEDDFKGIIDAGFNGIKSAGKKTGFARVKLTDIYIYLFLSVTLVYLFVNQSVG